MTTHTQDFSALEQRAVNMAKERFGRTHLALKKLERQFKQRGLTVTGRTPTTPKMQFVKPK